MATHETELKTMLEDLQLLEAEQAAVTEELNGNTDSQIESRPSPLPFRRNYLRLRSGKLVTAIKELKKKVKAKQEVIAWEARTS